MNRREDPGVPEALPRAVKSVVERLGVESVDRLWLFPPLTRGRRESGLVAVSKFAGERRLLFTAPYTAERTGRGLYMDTSFREQGECPPDSLPRVMDGVDRRSGDDLGDPREVAIGGDVAAFDHLMDEFDPALFREEVEPLSKVEV